jgi:hypothetical protein
MILTFRASAQHPAGEADTGEKLFNLSMPSPTADAKGAVAAAAILADQAAESLQTWLTQLPARPGPQQERNR